MVGDFIFYDSNHDETTDIADNRATQIGAMAIGISDVDDLKAKLTQLRKWEQSIKRLFFYTHGDPGSIHFGRSVLTSGRVLGELTGFQNLFRPNAEIGFDGCNVGDVKKGCTVGNSCSKTENGPVFLMAVAKTFLGASGGHVYGWTSAGWGFPAVGGSVIHHFNGTAIHIFIKKGGTQTRLAVGRMENPDPLGRWEVEIDKQIFYYRFDSPNKIGWTDASRYHAGVSTPVEEGTWRMEADGLKIAWQLGETETWDVPLYNEFQTGTAIDELGFDLSVVARVVPLDF
jgi:hypothetical protein